MTRYLHVMFARVPYYEDRDLGDEDDGLDKECEALERKIREDVFGLLSGPPQPYTDAPIALLKREFEKVATPERIAEIWSKTAPAEFNEFANAMDRWLLGMEADPDRSGSV